MNIFVDGFSAEDAEPEEIGNSTPAKDNRGGRPKQIEDLQQVLTRRDQLIQILSFSWGEVGWKLLISRRCEDLQAAFRPVQGFFQASEPLLRPFSRAAIRPTTASEIRETKKERARLVIAIHKLHDARKPFADKLQRSFDVLKQKTSNENLETLLDEHFYRMVSYRDVDQELDRAEKELKELATKLEEQEAYYAQTELLGFILEGKYAHNPRTLAQAMAGLPEVSCRYSFQQCEKTPSPLWPMRPEEIPDLYYRIFQLIEECCSRLSKEPDRPFVDIVRDRVRKIPPFNDLLNNLKPDWRYLRRAVIETDLTTMPFGAAPYRIFAAFLRMRGESRSHEENTLAEIEAAEI